MLTIIILTTIHFVTVENINAVTQDDCSTYHAFFLHKKPIYQFI